MLKNYAERKTFLLKLIGDSGCVVSHEHAPLQNIFYAYSEFCELSYNDFKKDLLNVWKEGLLGRITTSGGGSMRSEGLGPTYLYAYVGLKHDVLINGQKKNPLFGTYQPKTKKECVLRLITHIPASNRLPKDSFLIWDKGKYKLLCVIGDFKELEYDIKRLTKFDLDHLQCCSPMTGSLEKYNNELLEFSIKQNRIPLSLFAIKDKNNFIYVKKFNEHSLANIEYSDYIAALKEKVEKFLKKI